LACRSIDRRFSVQRFFVRSWHHPLGPLCAVSGQPMMCDE
jgi:hypothetical protein